VGGGNVSFRCWVGTDVLKGDGDEKIDSGIKWWGGGLGVWRWSELKNYLVPVLPVF